MTSDDFEVELQCPVCKQAGFYKKKLLDTFGKVRCLNCNEDISLVPFKLREQLVKISEYASQERTADWGDTLSELWDYVLTNSDELPNLDQQFRFDTCVELYLKGITFIPRYEYMSYEEKSVIDSLLSNEFDPSPHLPPDTPQYDSVLWRKMFAVHNQLLHRILEVGEHVLCIEEGAVHMGAGNRSRNGSIFLTNKRLIIIGRDFVKAHGETQSFPSYPGVEDYNILTYKLELRSRKSEGIWRYLISPLPSSANIYGSIDYFDLHKVQKLNLKKTHVDLEFDDFAFVDIIPREFSIPLLHPIGAVAAWLPIKGPIGKHHKTGKFKIRLSLGGLTCSSKDKSALVARHDSLARAIKEVVDSTVQSGPHLT
jgi:hypothetical protein